MLPILVASPHARGANAGSIISFTATVPEPATKDPHVQYDLKTTDEKFFLWMPAGADKQPCGLIVFIYSDDVMNHLPNGWEKVLTQQKLMFVAPQAAGNDQPTNRRMELAALAARAMMIEHKIDPGRLYAAGLSGGARMAGMLGFFEPDLFHGTIQSCGADFYEKVRRLLRAVPMTKLVMTTASSRPPLTKSTPPNRKSASRSSPAPTISVMPASWTSSTAAMKKPVSMPS